MLMALIILSTVMPIIALILKLFQGISQVIMVLGLVRQVLRVQEALHTQ